VLKIDVLDTCLFIPAYKAGLSRQVSGKNTAESRMKRLLIITGALSLLALFIAGAALVALLNLDKIIHHAVNTYGPTLTKTEVRLGDVDLRLVDGQAQLNDIYIGNPQGFALPKLLSAKTVHLVLDRLSLLGSPLIITRLEIDSPDICYEKTVKTDNFKALLKNMESSSAAAPGADTDNAASAPEKKKKKSRKVVIRELIIRNAQVTAIMAPLGGKKLTLTLPELRLSNVGGTSGSRPEEVARQVLEALYKTILSHAGPMNRILGTAGDTAQSVGEGVKKTIDKAAEGIKKLFGK
jgi:hypothetical protein